MSNVSFVRITLTKYMEKLNNGTLDNNTLYFVSTAVSDNNELEVPYLLYVGKNLIGNTGALVRYATNGIITINGNNINITDPVALSSNIVGMPGQTLFIINNYTNQNNETDVNTYMYYWDVDPNVTFTFGDTEIHGQWKNANITYTMTLSLGDIEITAEDLRKLKALLV